MPPDNSIAALNVPDSIRLSYVSYRMRANKHGRVFVRPRFRQQCAESLYFMGFNWSERRDLNSGPPVPQTGALTGLRYAPTIGPHYSQRSPKPQHAPARRRRTAHLAAP